MPFKTGHYLKKGVKYMELIDRYVYAVAKKFSGKQREDIEKELRAEIEDRVKQDKGSESYEEKVKKVLLKLGDPEIFIDKYPGTKGCLIGPKYYKMYILVLKIVIAAVFGGVSIAMLVQNFFTANNNIGKIAVNYITALFTGILQAFAVITIGFMIAERNNVTLNKKQWNLSNLPEVPDRKAVIPLSESVFSIIFNIIFYGLLYFTPEIFAAYFHSGNETITIPVFSPGVLHGYRALLAGIFLLSIFKEMFKLYYRRWMLKLSVIYVVLTAAAAVLVLIIFTNNSTWNPDFPTEIIKHINMSFNFSALWENIKSWFLAVVVFSASIDIITALYKGIRYNVKTRL